MRFFLIPAVIFLLANIAIDLFLYKKLKRASHKKISVGHGVTSLLLLSLLIITIALPRNNSNGNASLVSTMWLLFTYISCYIPKYVFCILNTIHYLISRIFHKGKSAIVTQALIAISALFFVVMWYGALITRNQIEVKTVTLEYANLPKEFNGYRIAQFSDLHLGSYGNDTTFVSRLVDEINAQKVDMICFTGDIVNSICAEALPFEKPLSRLSATDGVFSVLGNHDYGDYYHWSDTLQKIANFQKLNNFEANIGWHLLNNQETFLKRGNDSIAVIGVENWGEPPFPQYGNLSEAHPTLNDDVFKILLSHNPRHWRAEVLKKSNIKLMLAGHTHAMQMQFFGKSPSSLKYPEWGGLYEEPDSKLYVNVGIGEVGIPMRIGAKPEVTIITLKCAK